MPLRKVCLSLESDTIYNGCLWQMELQKQMAEKAKDGSLKAVNGSAGGDAQPKKKRRWDVSASEEQPQAKKKSDWEETPSHTRSVPKPWFHHM